MKTKLKRMVWEGKKKVFSLSSTYSVCLICFAVRSIHLLERHDLLPYKRFFHYGLIWTGGTPLWSTLLSRTALSGSPFCWVTGRGCEFGEIIYQSDPNVDSLWHSGKLSFTYISPVKVWLCKKQTRSAGGYEPWVCAIRSTGLSTISGLMVGRRVMRWGFTAVNAMAFEIEKDWTWIGKKKRIQKNTYVSNRFGRLLTSCRTGSVPGS